MFKFSIRQLFRQRGRALLFFLLMAASTALVVTGAVMTIENAQRIDKVESTYTTIGMIEQHPIDSKTVESDDSCLGYNAWSSPVYGDTMMMDVLDFPGANYIVKPEQRPYFIAYLPEVSYNWGTTIQRHIVEFTPLESTDGTEPVDIEITRVLHSDPNKLSVWGDGSQDKKMEVGDILSFSQRGNPVKHPLEVGERYVCNIQLGGICQTHGVPEYSTYIAPHTQQSDTQGNVLDRTAFYAGADEEDAKSVRLHHVTGDDYYEPGHFGYIYEQLVKQHEMENHLFNVMGATGLTALPSYHDGSMQIVQGREITPEEFEEGALVCMLPESTAKVSHLSVGDKIKLPLMGATYGGSYGLYYDFSLLNAQGEFYDVFWEQEYEIVGLFTGEQYFAAIEERDLLTDGFIIPINSVQASWEDNIMAWYLPVKNQATFQIPNGTIEEFDAALKENVPEIANLSITYDDRGYTEVMKSLRNSRYMAWLLLLGGILAALAIVALLLYFFVVKEKKRTAVERSLGMSKRQCRVSLLSGLAVLTAVSVLLGALCGTFALQKAQEEPKRSSTAAAEEPAPEELDAQYKFSTKFSMWATGRELAEDAVIEAHAPVTVYIAVPVLLCLLVEVLAWLLLERSFRTDPIYLLSTRENK